MSESMSDLIFFYLMCDSHCTPDEQVGDRYEPGDLVDRINRHACVWCPCANGVSNLRLLIPDYCVGSTNAFNIAGIILTSTLNGSSGRGWTANLKVSDDQIRALRMICLGRRLPGRLAIQGTPRFLRFTAAKRSVLRLLSLFESQDDLNWFLGPFGVGKFPFITNVESGKFVRFGAVVNTNVLEI